MSKEGGCSDGRDQWNNCFPDILPPHKYAKNRKYLNEEDENIHGDQDFEDVEKRDNFCEY